MGNVSAFETKILKTNSKKKNVDRILCKFNSLNESVKTTKILVKENLQ